MAVKNDVVMHWADKFAAEVVSRKDKKEYLVESGITPSGVVHVGNFREVITQELVYRALIDRGVKARYQYVWDSYDRFRKVPKGVNTDWEKYIGMPVCDVPDPWGCHKSYALHFSTQMEEELKAVGAHADFIYQHEEYRKCRYAEEVKTSLEKTETIKKILNKYRKENLTAGWLPVEIYCEKCNKDTTKPTYFGSYRLKYKCRCGHGGEFDFRKRGLVKLRWRTDWAGRWAHFDVDFESAGKDHHAAGGSWDTSSAICEQVFGQTPPISPMYEFIYLKGQKEKMSSSKGNVVTVSDLLEIFEPAVINYIYTAKINKAIEMPFDEDVLNIYNYFDEAERAYFEGGDKNEARRYELAVGKPKKIIRVPFSVCANTMQVARGDFDRALQILKKTGHAEKADAAVKKRLQLAWNWVQKYAPVHFRFQIAEQMPRITVDKKIKEVFASVAKVIGRGASGDEIQKAVYHEAVDRGLKLEDVFTAAYRLFLNKDRGPRLGPFLASLDPDFASRRLRLEA